MNIVDHGLSAHFDQITTAFVIFLLMGIVFGYGGGLYVLMRGARIWWGNRIHKR
jgi:hypothetical protein